MTTVIAEFIRRLDAGEPGTIDSFCEGYPEAQRAALHERCERIARIQRAMARPEAPDQPLGARIGDFVIREEIGSGGMGVVYRAEQLSLGREVALEVLPQHLTLSRRYVERFRNEARAIARLEHPGIVRVFTAGHETGAHFLVMELVAGGPLSDELAHLRGQLEAARRGPFRLSHATSRGYARLVADLVRQVADALSFAHGHGVIHRDVKPQNILLDQSGRPRLVDFGLAKIIDESSISQSGELAGTPYYYMSPEQALAKRVAVDHRTDIFSLGVILYELLRLQRPFEGSTSQQVLYEITFREPRPVRQVNPRVHRDLEVLCAKAIEKNPADRFADAGELAAELRRFLDGEPIPTKPPSVARRAARFVRKHKGTLAAAGVALAALGIGAWLAQPGLRTLRSRSALSVMPARPSRTDLRLPRRRGRGCVRHGPDLHFLADAAARAAGVSLTSRYTSRRDDQYETKLLPRQQRRSSGRAIPACRRDRQAPVRHAGRPAAHRARRRSNRPGHHVQARHRGRARGRRGRPGGTAYRLDAAVAGAGRVPRRVDLAGRAGSRVVWLLRQEHHDRARDHARRGCRAAAAGPGDAPVARVP
jgi:serine/threonine protein kinase